MFHVLVIYIKSYMKKFYMKTICFIYGSLIKLISIYRFSIYICFHISIFKDFTYILHEILFEFSYINFHIFHVFTYEFLQISEMTYMSFI